MTIHVQSPRARTIRTLVQVAVAVAGAVPAAIALLPIENTHALWVVGITGAFTLLVTAAQNAFEQSRGSDLSIPSTGHDAGQLL